MIESRLEKKIFLKQNKIFFFNNYIKEKKFKRIFQDRLVNSIYYDNNKFQSFYDSEEGVAPRKKIRLRYYENSENLFLEKKYTFQTNRAKQKFPKQQKKIVSSMYDSFYGIVRPIVKVSYLRSYYAFKNLRVTIDRNIEYNMYQSKFSIKDSSIVAEVKCSLSEENNFNLIFPFPQTRFSKYCNAIKRIYKK